MPVGGFEPQTDVQVITVPCDAAGEQTPTISELCLLACPDNVSMQLELIAIGYRANTLMIDTTDCHVDIEHIDDSASDAATDLVTDFDMEVENVTALVYNPVYLGSQILDAGDVINAEFTVTSPTTASEGVAFIVIFRVLRRSGA